MCTLLITKQLSKMHKNGAVNCNNFAQLQTSAIYCYCQHLLEQMHAFTFNSQSPCLSDKIHCKPRGRRVHAVTEF